MSVEQNNSAGGHGANVTGDSNVVIIGGAVEEASRLHQASGKKSGSGRVLVIAFVAAIVVYGLNVIAGCFETSGNVAEFPTKSDRYPDGATNASAIEATTKALQSCAKAVTLKPRNCPQSVDEYVFEPSEVRWTMYGSPADGAHVTYSDDRFHVLGAVIMVARYTTNQASEIKIEIVRFWAKLSWTNHAMRLDSIKALNSDKGPRVTKANPHAKQDAVLSALRAAFRACTAGHHLPMPAQCPQNQSYSSGDSTLSLDGDPAINSRLSFDPKSGLLHVKGSYSVTARGPRYFGSRATWTQSGDYDAVLAANGHSVIVLQILEAD